MVKLPRRAYKPRGLGRYGGARFNRYSRRSQRARRSAKIRKARSKARVAKRGYVDRVVKKAIKNKRNQLIQTKHSYALTQDLTYSNAYFPLGTRDQSDVTTYQVGNGAAIPLTEFQRLHTAQIGAGGAAYVTNGEIVGKGIKLHRITFKGHIFIDPVHWYSFGYPDGSDLSAYLDIFMFLMVDRKQKDTQIGYAGNHMVQDQNLRLTDFLVDRSQVNDTSVSNCYVATADQYTEWKGHYMQTLMPINTKRYKILKMLKVRLNPGQVFKPGKAETDIITYDADGNEHNINFPGRPSYANAPGFDCPFELTYAPKGGKHLSYNHTLIPHEGADEIIQGHDPDYYATNASGQMGGQDLSSLNKPVTPAVSESNKNHYTHAPKNFNPFLAVCYSRSSVGTNLQDSTAKHLANIEYNCQVVYENPLHN